MKKSPPPVCFHLRLGDKCQCSHGLSHPLTFSGNCTVCFTTGVPECFHMPHQRRFQASTSGCFWGSAGGCSGFYSRCCPRQVARIIEQPKKSFGAGRCSERQQQGLGRVTLHGFQKWRVGWNPFVRTRLGSPVQLPHAGNVWRHSEALAEAGVQPLTPKAPRINT